MRDIVEWLREWVLMDELPEFLLEAHIDCCESLISDFLAIT